MTQRSIYKIPVITTLIEIEPSHQSDMRFNRLCNRCLMLMCFSARWLSTQQTITEQLLSVNLKLQ